MEKNRRVFSVQSHVVSGYVGNKSATFPLQANTSVRSLSPVDQQSIRGYDPKSLQWVLGFEVDTVNSVQLSNHTLYRHWKGQVLNSQDLEELVDGLVLNNLHHYSHILTGYVGSLSFLEKVTETVKQLRKANPDLLYVCDPVMGDNGRMYVPKELLPEYKDNLVPLADVVTPNQFEIELLTGMSIKNEVDALDAMQLLHNKGNKIVVLTSTDLGSDAEIITYGSSVLKGRRTAITLKVPRYPCTFVGTGDLFTAVLLAWLTDSNFDLKLACEKTMATMQDVLKRTYAWATKAAGPDKPPSVAQLELKLIQSKADIEDPKSICSAVVLM